MRGRRELRSSGNTCWSRQTACCFSGGTTQYLVLVGEKELYRSAVMPRGQAGTPVSVDLGGAKEFTIKVGDGGDNINTD